MIKKQDVEEFLTQSTFAVAGVSRKGNKFGNYAFKNLKQKGFEVYAVHPAAESIEGEKCYPDFKSLPKPADAVVIVTKPEKTMNVLQNMLDSGIKMAWMQQGAESDKAIEFCIKNGIKEVHGECIMMFAEPVKSFHKFHRWVWGAVGKLPK
jgi:predicted CoA-binding protein